MHIIHFKRVSSKQASKQLKWTQQKDKTKQNEWMNDRSEPTHYSTVASASATSFQCHYEWRGKTKTEAKNQQQQWHQQEQEQHLHETTTAAAAVAVSLFSCSSILILFETVLSIIQYNNSISNFLHRKPPPAQRVNRAAMRSEEKAFVYNRWYKQPCSVCIVPIR